MDYYSVADEHSHPIVEFVGQEDGDFGSLEHVVFDDPVQEE